MNEDEDEWTDEESNDKLVARVNRMQLAELKDIVLSICPSFSITSKDGHTYPLLLYDAKTIPKNVFQACFKLVESNLKHLYEASSFGWSKKEKQAEMREPATRFLILQYPNSEAVIGFLSWQVDTDEDEAVIYCYELQLQSSLRRSGIGGKFMEILEHLGTSFNLSKSMLTVFTSNTSALSFYTKLGYTIDPSSPTPRTLRSNRTIPPDYQILSKTLTIL